MKKKLVLGLTALVVTSAVAIGGTLAFMTAHTSEKINSFTAVGSNVSGQIKETNWDGLDFDGITQTIPADTVTLGKNKAIAMTPGMDIPKDPMLKNTSPIPVYMAMKVTYNTKTAFQPNSDRLTLATLRNAGGSEGINSGWVYYSTSSDGLSDYYIYASQNQTGITALTEVAKDNGTTQPLFDSVKINADATNEQIVGMNFNITVKGAAVQTSDLGSIDTGIQQLINALDAN